MNEPTEPPATPPAESDAELEVADIVPAEVQYISPTYTASQIRKMAEPRTRVAVAGNPINRAYRRAERAHNRKNPKPKKEPS
jgi:hypothetical protein